MHADACWNARARAFLCALALTPVLGACAGIARHSPPGPPAATEVAAAGEPVAPFLGLGLGTSDGRRALVLGTVAGPAASAGLRKGDRIVAVDGIGLDAESVRALLADAVPGQRLLLDVLRDGEAVRIELTVGTREQWQGPIAYAAAVPFAHTGLEQAPPWPDPALAQALSAAPDLLPVDERLERMFAQLARDDRGFHKLPRVREALLRPGAMQAWRHALAEDVWAVSRQPARLAQAICDALAVACPESRDEQRVQPPTLAGFADAVADANRRVRAIFLAAGIDRGQAAADLHYLASRTARDRTLLNQPGVERGIRAMRESMRLDLGALLAVFDAQLAAAQRLPRAAGAPVAPPASLAPHVQGEILDYAEVEGGFVVIGGSGPNRYDMDRLLAVIDIGGDDEYRWSGLAPAAQVVIDRGGNDRYLAVRGGPGAGWLGVALLIDRRGDDRYESALGGCGAGVFGVGLLIDEAGNDRYVCAAWSAGAGLYGAGVLVDGGGDDSYLSQSFSQGVGGPRGLGVLLDAGGGDLYRANGPVPSAYGTPAVFMGFSQGVGVGIRPYDTGGIGALIDLGGDDRYEGGEFSQGGGYYWGAGFLHDAAGNDLYYGNRYAQGFAAHQAFGMLSDLAGDDVYWAMTAAGQGAAWDQAIALLFDAGGDDHYRAAQLGQGAAAQQARAALHDALGDDVYISAHPVAQGAAGDNVYHFRADDPVHSLGVLLDERGDDRYSSGLANGESRLRLRAGANGRGVAGFAGDRD